MSYKAISFTPNSYQETAPEYEFNALSKQIQHQLRRYKLNNQLTKFSYLLSPLGFLMPFGLKKDFYFDNKLKTPLTIQVRSIFYGYFLMCHLSFWSQLYFSCNE